MSHFNYHIEFLTATILRWQHLLKDDTLKQIIVNSLAWLHQERRCIIHGFVIMPNHIHLLWRISDECTRVEVQGGLLRYTAHQFKTHLTKTNAEELNRYHVDEADRVYQFWERDSRVKECWSQPYLMQRLNYIHYNPCQPHWLLSNTPEDYCWSSAAFYYNGTNGFDWLTHWNE